jgi:hypothetical protein
VKVGDLVTHTPELSSMKILYEALDDCAAQFSIGLIVDIKRCLRSHCGYACVSSAQTPQLYWYSFDELETISKQK